MSKEDLVIKTSGRCGCGYHRCASCLITVACGMVCADEREREREERGRVMME